LPTDVQESRERLVAILQLAYSGELAAGLAYRGHWRSLKDEQERDRVRAIEDEEWHHRHLVGEMLTRLRARPLRSRELRAHAIGRTLGVLCHLSGWFAPMYGAGRLESRNIREYEAAARYARDAGHAEFVACLLGMAEVEWEHEHYFRARVESHRWSRHVPLWPAPARKESIRSAFARKAELSLSGAAASNGDV
jgi:rubrerythrin